MFRKAIVAGVIGLLILTTGFASEQNRVIHILDIAKKVDATQKQVAAAIAGGATPKEFAVQVTGKIRLVAPDKAPKGSPVQIAVEGMPEKAAEIWRRYPIFPTDVWLELYDRNGNPVNIFWSSDQGPRTFELIVAENGPDVPTLDMATHLLQYGEDTVPVPVPIVPDPSPALQLAVQPLVEFEIEASDLLNLTEFYHDFADVVRRDNGSTIATTAILRATYMSAGKLMFQQTDMTGKYVGLSTIIDNIIATQIGLDIVPLNVPLTADTLDAVAWACSKGRK